MSLMCNFSEEVWEKGKENMILENIRNQMDTIKLTVEQAMAALKIPEEEQSKYFDMLGGIIMFLLPVHIDYNQ